MNKKMLEDYCATQKMLLMKKEMLIKECHDMEYYNSILSDETKKLSEDYVNDIKESMKKMMEQQKQVLEAVTNLKNVKARIAMQIRYIEGGTINDICEKMAVSARTANRYLDAAFKELGITRS